MQEAVGMTSKSLLLCSYYDVACDATKESQVAASCCTINVLCNCNVLVVLRR